jgi:tetratricopeptide (TPR) repeat protein
LRQSFFTDKLAAMRTTGILLAVIFMMPFSALGQPAGSSGVKLAPADHNGRPTWPLNGFNNNKSYYQLALASHNGQLSWSVNDFKEVQASAKPNGHEIGVRGADNSGHLFFLGFLFLFPEQAPMTSAKCRDGVIGPEKKENKSMQVLNTTEIAEPNALPVTVVDYTERGNDGKTDYMVRGFVATADLCGDLEFYADTPIHAADPLLHHVFTSFKLDPNHVPQFIDAFLYDQILYDNQQFAAAGPLFEELLMRSKNEPDQDLDLIRVLTDQAGMSYGMAGNIAKARSIFESAIPSDPGYPMYYYNLACADAEENKLADAQKHLQQAFDRKANVIHGESMPDPTQDDSFTPYQNNKQFWSFVESLRSK